MCMQNLFLVDFPIVQQTLHHFWKDFTRIIDKIWSQTLWVYFIMDNCGLVTDILSQDQQCIHIALDCSQSPIFPWNRMAISVSWCKRNWGEYKMPAGGGGGVTRRTLPFQWGHPLALCTLPIFARIKTPRWRPAVELNDWYLRSHGKKYIAEAQKYKFSSDFFMRYTFPLRNLLSNQCCWTVLQLLLLSSTGEEKVFRPDLRIDGR